MKERKFLIFLASGITLFFALFALLIAATSGEGIKNFIGYFIFVFVLFGAPAYIFIIFEFITRRESNYSFICCFYYLGLLIVVFVHQVITPVESAGLVIICFSISFAICYAVNKISKLKKKVEELERYKKTAEPYMEFFEMKAEKCGMGMYDYLTECKKYEGMNSGK